MQIGTGDHVYTWHEDWAKIPDTPSGRMNGRTHAGCVLADGRVLVFNQADPAILLFDPDGKLIEGHSDRFMGAHGLTKVVEDGTEYLWLVDEASCAVVKTTIEGEILQKLAPPPEAARPNGRYKPTWAAVSPTGDIWVADGYGGSAVHRYTAAGEYVSTLTGEDGAGRFNCPHGNAFGPDGLHYIADRANNRIAVYDVEGRHQHHVDDACHSPCGFSFHDGLILVPELFTGVKLLNGDLDVVVELGGNPAIRPDGMQRNDEPRDAPARWPNLAGTEHIREGFFNSPHGACFGPDGSIYVFEWIVGGRITKLSKTG